MRQEDKVKTLLLFAQLVSRARTVYRFCDGERHFEVEKFFNHSIASEDGGCNQVDCVRGESFSDWNLFTPSCQDILGAKILVPEGKVLLYEDKVADICKIFSAGDEIYPYQLKLGQVLHFGGSAILCGGSVVTSPVKGERNDVVLNVQGKAVFSTIEKEEEKEKARLIAEQQRAEAEALVVERKQFAREQQQKLRALGFDAVESYKIVGAAGPTDAIAAVEYAYRLYHLYESLNPTLKAMVASRVMFDLEKVTDRQIWSSEVKIRAIMFSLKLPLPAFKHASQLRSIISGAKIALEIGLPGKRVKKQQLKVA